MFSSTERKMPAIVFIVNKKINSEKTTDDNNTTITIITT